MTNMLFYVLLLGLSATFMNGSIRYSGINRSFYLLQRGIFEYAVITCDEEHEPYFDQNILKESIDNYLSINISRYVKHYTISIVYLNDDNTICVNSFCQSVKVSLKADINYLFSFDKALVFTISSLEGNANE